MKNIAIRISGKAEKEIRKLPPFIRTKLQKQLKFLIKNDTHPSLRVKKMKGEKNMYEARIDYHYRLTFRKEQESISIYTVGPHDKGLGKK